MNVNKERFKFRLGLFVIGGFLLFIVAIFIIGKQNYLFDRVFTISTKFYDVSGLQVGNNVRFSGINVGTVEKIIIINDSMVQVDLVILERVQEYIKTDSEIGIGSEGIIGDKILYITQGGANSPKIKKKQFLFSFEPINTDDILKSVEASALNAEVITQDLSEIMQKINSGQGTLGRLIQDTSIANNLSNAMKSIESSSQGLDQNMEAAKDNFLLRGHFRRKEREARKKKELEEKN